MIRFDGRVTSFKAGTESYHIDYNEQNDEIPDVIPTQSWPGKPTPPQSIGLDRAAVRGYHVQDLFVLVVVLCAIALGNEQNVYKREGQ